jgi:hypothetical protein
MKVPSGRPRPETWRNPYHLLPGTFGRRRQGEAVNPNPVSRRDEGLSRISRVTRWSIAGAVVAAVGVTGVVANAQPGRSTTPSNVGADTVTDVGPAAEIPTPSTSVTPGRATPALPTAPKPTPAPSRRRQQPAVTTTRGS